MIKKIFILLCIGSISLMAENKKDVPSVAESFVCTKDAELFCRTIGKGKPLVIIHGGPGLSQDYLFPQLQILSANNRVIFYDQRGCGGSSGKIGQDTITLKAFVDDLEMIRKDLNVDKLSLLGHSWGALLAMHYAIAHPEAVDKLILSNTMPASSEGFFQFVQEYMCRTGPHEEQLNAIQNDSKFKEGNPELFEKMYRIIFRTYCFDPKKADALNVRMSAAAAVHGAQVYEMIRQNVFAKPYDLYPPLKTLPVKTLIIHGDTDPVPCALAEQIHKNIKGSRFVLIKNCGHFPYVEEPQEYFKAIEEFLKD